MTPYQSYEQARMRGGSRSEYNGSQPLANRAHQPAPRPRMARPEEMWSMVVTIFATSPGLRKLLADTSSPTDAWRSVGSEVGQPVGKRRAGPLDVVLEDLLGSVDDAVGLNRTADVLAVVGHTDGEGGCAGDQLLDGEVDLMEEPSVLVVTRDVETVKMAHAQWLWRMGEMKQTVRENPSAPAITAGQQV